MSADVDFATKTMHATAESEAAFAWLQEHGKIPDLKKGRTRDGLTGWTYPYGLCIPALGQTHGVPPSWVIESAEEKGFVYQSADGEQVISPIG